MIAKYILGVAIALFVWQWVGDIADSPIVPTSALETSRVAIAQFSYDAGVFCAWVWRNLWQAICDLWQRIKDVAEWIWETLKDIWNNLWQWIKDIADWMWRNLFKQAAKSLWKLGAAFADNAWAVMAFVPGYLSHCLPKSFDASAFYVFSRDWTNPFQFDMLVSEYSIPVVSTIFWTFTFVFMVWWYSARVRQALRAKMSFVRNMYRLLINVFKDEEEDATLDSQ